MLAKNIHRCIILVFLCIITLGCAATYRGEGIILSQQKIQGQIARNNLTKTGAKMGATTLGAVGIGVGAFAGIGISALTAPNTSLVLASAAIGAASIGLPCLIIGAGLGGGVGFISEQIISNKTNYAYSVRSLDDVHHTYTIIQHSSPIPVKTTVKIYEKNGTLFIRK